jgi:PAS domain S-box-containing protein
MSGDSVLALFEDREGLLWVSTTNGIDSFRDPAVTTFSEVEGLGPDSAFGVLASRDGTVWVANGDSLDHIEKNGTISSIRWGKGLPGDQVTSMLEDRAGNLWIGVGDGLYLLENGHFRRISEPDLKPFGLIVSLTEDIDGNIWAECSGESRKLVRIRNFQVQEEFSPPHVPPGRLVADPHGGIWIGTRKRNLVLFRNGVVQNFPINSNEDLFTNDLRVQADGSVLAAFDDGLLGLRKGKIQRMTMKHGLPCNTLFSIIEDKEKRWWLNSNCGIIELPDSELQRWWANPEAVVRTRVYDALDGVRPGRVVINPAALSPDGRVWFATGFFVQMVDPSRLAEKAPPALTYIESVTVDRKEYSAGNNLKLPANPRDLQIDYTSPTFAIPQRVKFRYRLDGYDRDWHDAGTRRQAFYTDLPPGNYSFHVMASNSDGVWSNTPAKLAFSIAPAFYQTTWFRTLSALMLLAMLGAAYQLRVHQLHQEVKKLQDVIETIPAMAFTFLPDGSNAFINQRWAEYTGLSAQDTAGSGWTSVVHPDDLHIYEPWRASIAAGTPFELELRFRSAANGNYRWFLARGVPQRDHHGKILRWYGILTDIEDLKRAEEVSRRGAVLEATNKELEAFAYSISHDLRAPLRHLAGFAELLLKRTAGSTDEKSVHYTTMILEAAKRMGILIDDLLGFSRVSRAEVHFSMVDLNQIVQEAVAEVTQDLKDRDIEWKIHSLPKWEGDRSMLRLALINLISNAVKFTRSRAHAEIEIGLSECTQDRIVLFVRDNGVGFDMKYYNKLFGVFQRLHSQDAFEGTGIGLATVQRIVHRHGGDIWAEGTVDAGATFYFSLGKIKE